MEKEIKFLDKVSTVSGVSQSYNCKFESYTLLKKYNYIIKGDYLYIATSTYLKDGKILRNYSFVNVFDSLEDFLKINLSIISNKEVYFISLNEYKHLSVEFIVQDIKSKNSDDNFCLNALPQSL